jgi:hypothetical protein
MRRSARRPIVIIAAALREPRWYIVKIGDTLDEIVYNIGGVKGAEPGLFCLTGPDYHGPMPANMTEIKVLEHEHVRGQGSLHRERLQAVQHRQHDRRTEGGRAWIDHDLHPARESRSGQVVELATGIGLFQRDDAVVRFGESDP